MVLHADKGRMQPAELREWLVDATIDIGAEGQDDESGAGFLTLNDVPWRGCHCSQSQHGSQRTASSWLAAMGLIGFLRRRRLG